jgi:hypothetical protein
LQRAVEVRTRTESARAIDYNALDRVRRTARARTSDREEQSRDRERKADGVFGEAQRLILSGDVPLVGPLAR